MPLNGSARPGRSAAMDRAQESRRAGAAAGPASGPAGQRRVRASRLRRQRARRLRERRGEASCRADRSRSCAEHDLHARVSKLFDDDMMVALTFAVVVINACSVCRPGRINPSADRDRVSWVVRSGQRRAALHPSSRAVRRSRSPSPLQALGPTRLHFVAQTGACPRSGSRVGSSVGAHRGTTGERAAIR